MAKDKPQKFTQPINTEKRKFQGSYPSQKKDKPKTFPKTNYKETNQECPLPSQNQNRLDNGQQYSRGRGQQCGSFRGHHGSNRGGFRGTGAPNTFFIDLITSGGSIQDQFSLPPVGAMLQENWQNWEQLKASSWVVLILKHGYRLLMMMMMMMMMMMILFRNHIFNLNKIHIYDTSEYNVISGKPPITKNTGVFQASRVSTKETTLGVRNKIIGKQKSNRIGTTRETSILQQNVSGTKIRGSVAPDNRFVNFEQISQYPQFSYGNSIRLAIQPQDWTISIDLSDAYLHIPIHRDHRKYLSVAHQNQIWRFRALAVGLSPAPWIFTRVVEEVKKMAQNRSLIMYQYLDDWLVRSQSRELLVEQTQWLLGPICKYLGLQVNLAKSELHPTKDFEYVGYRYKTGINKVFPKEKRIRDIQGKQFLEMNPNTAQDWMSMLGY